MTRKALSTSQKWEMYFSVLNHLMIGSVSLFVTWHCYHSGITAYTMHVWLSTIGVSPRNHFLWIAVTFPTIFSINCWWLRRFWRCTHQIVGHFSTWSAPNEPYIGSCKWLDRFLQLLARFAFIGEEIHISVQSIRSPASIQTKKKTQRTRLFFIFYSSSGLISLILLVIGLINGSSALWAHELSKLAKIRPVYTKLLHNVVGIAAFVIGKP